MAATAPVAVGSSLGGASSVERRGTAPLTALRRRVTTFRSMGVGHAKKKGPTEEAVLADVLSHVDSVENQVFMAEEWQSGECGTVRQ